MPAFKEYDVEIKFRVETWSNKVKTQNRIKQMISDKFWHSEVIELEVKERKDA